MQNSVSYSIVDVNIITFICQKNCYKYIKREEIRSKIIFTVCLVKVRMKFSLYKRVTTQFGKDKTKLETKAEEGACFNSGNPKVRLSIN